MFLLILSVFDTSRIKVVESKSKASVFQPFKHLSAMIA